MFDSGVQKSLENGSKYIILNQQENGSFLTFSSPYPTNFEKAIHFKSIFSTALILQSLIRLHDMHSLKKTKRNAAKFLLTQKSPLWTWNYWDRTSKEAKTLPYPDDLDDTFCAMSALYLYKKSLITGNALGCATQMLTSLEVNEGGPYKTWLVNDEASEVWKDVDLGVNANIAYFLFLQKITLPNLTRLFDAALKTENLTTPYYPKPFPVLYFFSRFIEGKERKEALRKILLKLQPDTALDKALKITSLLNSATSPKLLDELIKNLLELQNTDGSWNASGFYTGVNPKKDKTFYAGSQALTTAFCLEALQLYGEKKTKKSKATLQNKNNKNYATDVHAKILDNVKKRFSELGSNLQSEARIYMKQILKNDKEMQITLLPYMFYKSLAVLDEDIPQDILVKLGSASVYGWIAYTIYDNFLDEEAIISSLPIANICLRELTIIMDSLLPAETGFQDLCKQIMDRLEEVNTWEVVNCHVDKTQIFEKLKLPEYKNYQVLADRSMGHALGCIAILISMGYKKDSIEVTSLLSFFSHYLIARQLNDDAHDWEKDLKMGHINSVGALLLAKSNKDLEKIFWHEVIDGVCDLILIHAKLARESLSKISVIKNQKILDRLIEKQELSVTLTKKEKQKTLAFLKTYTR